MDCLYYCLCLLLGAPVSVKFIFLQFSAADLCVCRHTYIYLQKYLLTFRFRYLKMNSDICELRFLDLLDFCSTYCGTYCT